MNDSQRAWELAMVLIANGRIPFDPANPSGLANLAASTGARLGVGRAGPRPRTASMLLFQADHAVTQDAIFGDVPTALLEQFGLFTVQTQVTSAQEYLLRPDLGRAPGHFASENYW